MTRTYTHASEVISLFLNKFYYLTETSYFLSVSQTFENSFFIINVILFYGQIIMKMWIGGDENV